MPWMIFAVPLTVPTTELSENFTLEPTKERFDQ